MFQRKLNVPLSLVHPSMKEKVQARQQKQKAWHDVHAKERKFSVFVRNYVRGPLWLPGQVLEFINDKLYLIMLTHGRRVRKHIDQIRRRSTDSKEQVNFPVEGKDAIDFEIDTCVDTEFGEANERPERNPNGEDTPNYELKLLLRHLCSVFLKE